MPNNHVHALNGRVIRPEAAPPPAPTLALTVVEERHLQQLEQKLQLIRDRVIGVARGFTTGFFLHGPGGAGKSYTVVTELERLQVNYLLTNSRMTSRALFDALEKHPDCIHVIEEAEHLLLSKIAVGVLRSALWHQDHQGRTGTPERWVTWRIHGRDSEVLFSGGIIVLSNEPLLQHRTLDALKTRIVTLQLQPTDSELRALMRQICLKGYSHGGLSMTPPECWEVCDFIFAESLALRRPLDLRLLINSFADYLQFQEGEAGCHWRDLIRARIRERPTAFRAPVDIGERTARKDRELEIAREIAAATSDREERRRLWTERTGKSEQSLYRRLSDLRRKAQVPPAE